MYLVPFIFVLETLLPDCRGLLGLAGRYFSARSGQRNITFMFSEAERKGLFLVPFWKEKSMLETSDLVMEI